MRNERKDETALVERERIRGYFWEQQVVKVAKVVTSRGISERNANRGTRGEERGRRRWRQWTTVEMKKG